MFQIKLKNYLWNDTVYGKLLPRIKISKGNVVPKCNKGLSWSWLYGSWIHNCRRGWHYQRGVHCKASEWPCKRGTTVLYIWSNHSILWPHFLSCLYIIMSLFLNRRLFWHWLLKKMSLSENRNLPLWWLLCIISKAAPYLYLAAFKDWDVSDL